MTLADIRRSFENTPAASPALTAEAKMKLINDVTDALGIGGWSAPECGGGWDISDEDMESEWSELVAKAAKAGDECISAYRVALLLATEWERQCVTVG